MPACLKCGREVSDAARFCSGCGHAPSAIYKAPAKPGFNTGKRIFFSIAAGIGLFLILVGIGMVAGYKAHTRYSASQEVAAIQQIRAISQAETQYYSQFQKYAPSLEDLGDSIPSTLADGKSYGFVFALKARQDGYALNVTADGSDTGSQRNFYSDETLVIHANDTIAVPATAASPELK